jgi:hypothetical protein
MSSSSAEVDAFVRVGDRKCLLDSQLRLNVHATFGNNIVLLRVDADSSTAIVPLDADGRTASALSVGATYRLECTKKKNGKLAKKIDFSLFFSFSICFVFFFFFFFFQKQLLLRCCWQVVILKCVLNGRQIQFISHFISDVLISKFHCESSLASCASKRCLRKAQRNPNGAHFPISKQFPISKPTCCAQPTQRRRR